MGIGNINDIIRNSQGMLTAFEYGVDPVSHDYLKKRKDLASRFGGQFVAEKEADIRHRENLENRILKYDEDNFVQYTNKRYHTDIKPWLDYIQLSNMPLELYKTDGKTEWQDGNYNWTSLDSKIYRLKDTETKYMVDFELYDDDFGS